MEGVWSLARIPPWPVDSQLLPHTAGSSTGWDVSKPCVATLLGFTINLNFKFMLVAFFFLNTKTLLCYLLHKEYVC